MFDPDLIWTPSTSFRAIKKESASSARRELSPIFGDGLKDQAAEIWG
jgi:hypothetical protein